MIPAGTASSKNTATQITIMICFFKKLYSFDAITVCQGHITTTLIVLQVEIIVIRY